MKRFLGLAVLALGFALPAHAQLSGGSVGSGTSLSGSGGLNGAVSCHTLPSYPPANLAMIVISGTANSFIPSGFVSYEQAVAEGRAALSAKARSLAEAAEENSNSQKARAKFALVQDAKGEAVIVSR